MGLGALVGIGLALVVGISLGLLGGGGSILTVPILTYIVGLDPREAIAASLFIVGVTSLVGLIPHARAGRVAWKVGAAFGIASMVGAFIGGLAGGHINGHILMVLFAAMMVATAVAMIQGRRKASSAQAGTTTSSRSWRIIGDGLGVGAATGLVGAGGGFLVVPALTLLGGLPMATAVGTSLVVIGVKSFAGLSGYLLSVQFNWVLILVFTAVAILGSVIGSHAAGRVKEESLRKGFGYFVFIMGIIVLAQEAPNLFRLATGG